MKAEKSMSLSSIDGLLCLRERSEIDIRAR